MTVRETVFERDNGCRICQVLGIEVARHPWMGILEWVHLKARGMGGNPDGSRDTTENTICGCRFHHQGVRSLHSGHLKYVFLTDKGADGPMAFTWHEKLPKADLGPKP